MYGIQPSWAFKVPDLQKKRGEKAKLELPVLFREMPVGRFGELAEGGVPH